MVCRKRLPRVTRGRERHPKTRKARGTICAAELAPFSWEYLTFLTTSPNEWRKKRARMGMNGVQKASPRVTSVRERLTKAVLCLLDLMACFYSLRQLRSLTIHSTWEKFRVTCAAVWHSGKLMGNAVKYRLERGSNMEER